VGAQSSVTIFLDVVLVGVVVAAQHILKGVPLFKLEVVEIDHLFDDALAALVLSHKLDQLIDDPLEVGVSLVSDLTVAPQVHE